MSKKLFLLAVLLIFTACGKDDVAIPQDVLTKEQMVDLLIDIRIAEGMVGSVTMSEDSARAVFQAFEKRIFKEHQIDSVSYTRSHNFYLMHPNIYLEVTDAVLDSLKARNSRQYSRNY